MCCFEPTAPKYFALRSLMLKFDRDVTTRVIDSSLTWFAFLYVSKWLQSFGWRKWRLCSTHYGPVTRNYSYDHKRWKKLAQVSLWRLVERNDDFWLQTAIDKTIVFSTTKTVIILCITFALKEERHVSWWRQTVLTSLSNFDLMHATETWKVQVKPRWIKCRRQLS